MNTLQALKPVSVVPSIQRTQLQDAPVVMALKHMKFVRVRSSRTEGYTIEMHSNASSSSSRIPTTNLQGQAFPSTTLSSSKPDAHVERSYADFLKLQAQLLHCVHATHRSILCAFCYEVSSTATWGGTQSSPLAMLAMSEDELADTFTTFIIELLALTRTRFSSQRSDGGMCCAQGSVSQMLREFLAQE